MEQIIQNPHGGNGLKHKSCELLANHPVKNRQENVKVMLKIYTKFEKYCENCTNKNAYLNKVENNFGNLNQIVKKKTETVDHIMYIFISSFL